MFEVGEGVITGALVAFGSATSWIVSGKRRRLSEDHSELTNESAAFKLYQDSLQVLRTTQEMLSDEVEAREEMSGDLNDVRRRLAQCERARAEGVTARAEQGLLIARLEEQVLALSQKGVSPSASV